MLFLAMKQLLMKKPLVIRVLGKHQEAAEGSIKAICKEHRVTINISILHGYCLFVLTVLVLHIKPIKRSIHVDFNGKIRKAKKIGNCVFLYLLVSLQMQVQWSIFEKLAKMRNNMYMSTKLLQL